MIPRSPSGVPLMARPKSDRPSYCLHKQSGRARITIDGKQKLLPGAYDSPESRAEYDRLVGTWFANGRTLPTEPSAPSGPTVSMIDMTRSVSRTDPISARCALHLTGFPARLTPKHAPHRRDTTSSC